VLEIGTAEGGAEHVCGRPLVLVELHDIALAVSWSGERNDSW
jgi:hypothetical protein